MSSMTQEQLNQAIRDVVGEEIADMREELAEKNKEDNTDGARAAVLGQSKQAEEAPAKGIRLARWVRVLTAARGDTDKAAQIAQKWGDEQLQKVLVESTLEDGGALAPPEYVAEVIELLRARATVRSLGATSMPMNAGTLNIPYLSQGTSASYVGESSNIPTTSLKTGLMSLTAKKLAAIVPLSNDLLRDGGSSPQVDAIVRNDLVRELGLREDLAFIRDDGTEYTPTGIRHLADAAHVFDRTQDGGVNTLATATADLSKMVRVVEEGDVPLESPGWIMTPRTKWWLMSLRDGNGNFAFKPEMDGGTLFGFPFRVTTQIPSNLGGGTETELYFCDFASAIIGENTQLIIEPFQGGAYHDGSNVQSGISLDQTVIRAIAKHDFGLRYRGVEAAVLTAVDWGA